MVFLAVREGATSGIYAIPMSAIPNESAGQTALQNSIKNYLIKELVSDSEGSSGEYMILPNGIRSRGWFCFTLDTVQIRLHLLEIGCALLS